VELGREIDSLLGTIEGSLGVDLMPFIQKSKLDRASWEESNQLFDRQTDWDRFAEYAPVGKGPVLAPGVGALLEDGPPPPYLMGASPDRRDFAYAVMPLREMGGEVVGRLVISRDMTDLEQRFRQALTLWSGVVLAVSVLVLAFAKRFLGRLDQRLAEANARLRLAHDTLEDRVKARTRDLTDQVARREAAEVQLRQAQKMEAVGQLTGGIAHDFNNLLTVIIGNIDLLTLEPLKPSSRNMAQETLKAAERAASLTRQLLAVSRRQVLQPRSLDPVELVRGLEGLLQRALGETIRVRITASPTGWNCCADAAQLESALLNLAVNARDAMPDGGVLDVRVLTETLKADVIENLEAGDYVVFEVEDNGVGMENALLERVFEPFFTTKELGVGTGLGLSMVYGFAEQSGGHATIVSTVGRGTKVSVYLPRSEPGTPADTPHHGRQLVGAGNGERILVVEDDPQVRLYACRMLHELGYRTYESADAREALGVLEQRDDVKLVFSDLVLPGGGSGMDLKRTVTERYPSIPVILTSGYTAGKLDDDTDVDIIEKPYRRETLAMRITVALREAFPVTRGLGAGSGSGILPRA
jgi:signal transduction histidine kinase/CheY-like chemotaxis protein